MEEGREMTASEAQKEVTLVAKVGNHREVLLVLKNRLDVAERRIRQLEKEVHGTVSDEKELPAVGTIY